MNRWCVLIIENKNHSHTVLHILHTLDLNTVVWKLQKINVLGVQIRSTIMSNYIWNKILFHRNEFEVLELLILIKQAKKKRKRRGNRMAWITHWILWHWFMCSKHYTCVHNVFTGEYVDPIFWLLVLIFLMCSKIRCGNALQSPYSFDIYIYISNIMQTGCRWLYILLRLLAILTAKKNNNNKKVV